MKIDSFHIHLNHNFPSPNPPIFPVSTHIIYILSDVCIPFHPRNQILMRRKDVFYHLVLVMAWWIEERGTPYILMDQKQKSVALKKTESNPIPLVIHLPVRCHVPRIHASQISDNSMGPRIQACGPRETFHASVSHCQRKILSNFTLTSYVYFKKRKWTELQINKKTTKMRSRQNFIFLGKKRRSHEQINPFPLANV